MERKAPQIGPLKPSSGAGDALYAGSQRRAPVLDPENVGKKKKTRSRKLWRKLLTGLGVLLLCISVVPVALLSVVPVWTSSFMLQYQASRITAERPMPALEHRWVPWERISPQAKLAAIAAEDQRFATHPGIDIRAIGNAIEHNRRGGRTRGASTISQQVAKNLFLWSDRSWLRKGLEVGYTLLIELIWSKRRVLEVYLNIAEFGPGVYGVEAASQKYFGKPASRLSEYEAALLASVLPNPKRLQVVDPSLHVQNRAAWIRGQMQQLGMQVVEQL